FQARQGLGARAAEHEERDGVTVTRLLAAMGLVVVLALVPPAQAGRVRHVLRTAPDLVGLPGVASERYQNAADLILEQGVRNLPLFPAASSAFTWRWNPETGGYERTSDEVSPLYTERGQTMGEGLLNASVTFGYFDVACSSGCRLGTDPRPLSVSAAAIRYQAPTDLTYTVSTFNFTYGVTDDLDVNVAIPIATLDMGLDVTRQDNPTAPIHFASRNVEAANIADTMVRAKYRLFTTTGSLGSTAGAAGLRVRLPTGDPTPGLGPVFGEIGPYLALSTVWFDGWLASPGAGGVDGGIGALRRSSAPYSWALALHAPRGDEWWRRIALAGSVLGGSEFVGLRQPP